MLSLISILFGYILGIADFYQIVFQIPFVCLYCLFLQLVDSGNSTDRLPDMRPFLKLWNKNF